MPPRVIVGCDTANAPAPEGTNVPIAANVETERFTVP
jgi:hypothetical protein